MLIPLVSTCHSEWYCCQPSLPNVCHISSILCSIVLPLLYLNWFTTYASIAASPPPPLFSSPHITQQPLFCDVHSAFTFFCWSNSTISNAGDCFYASLWNLPHQVVLYLLPHHTSPPAIATIHRVFTINKAFINNFQGHFHATLSISSLWQFPNTTITDLSHFFHSYKSTLPSHLKPASPIALPHASPWPVMHDNIHQLIENPFNLHWVLAHSYEGSLWEHVQPPHSPPLHPCPCPHQ